MGFDPRVTNGVLAPIEAHEILKEAHNRAVLRRPLNLRLGTDPSGMVKSAFVIGRLTSNSQPIKNVVFK